MVTAPRRKAKQVASIDPVSRKSQAKMSSFLSLSVIFTKP